MPVPEIGPLRKRACLLRCRLSYAQQRIRELEAVLEQALDCIRGETPEDITPEDAREDTISKIRAVLLDEEEK